MLNYRTTITQHAVGQGGFLVGQFHPGTSAFTWAYDCGSNQLNALNSAISYVATQQAIDCLFISHLDKDHVVGIDRLVSTVGVTEVVLPYLNDEERALLVAREAASEVFSHAFLEMLANPVSWFADRGVRRVTFIQSGESSPDFPPGDPRSGTDPDSLDKGPFKPKWHGNVVTNDATEQVLAPGAFLGVGLPSGYIGWILVPHVFSPPQPRMRAFMSEIEREFGNAVTIDQITAAARHSNERERLRECYNALWKNHNLISMSLYAGPLPGGRNTPIVQSTIYPSEGPSSHFFEHSAIGWMSTGDADFSVKARRQRFFTHYQRVLSEVGQIVLPHHGSRHNFHVSLIRNLPHVRYAIVAAGPNSYDHPSPAVRLIAETIEGKHFAHVSEEPSSTFLARSIVSSR